MNSFFEFEIFDVNDSIAGVLLFSLDILYDAGKVCHKDNERERDTGECGKGEREGRRDGGTEGRRDGRTDGQTDGRGGSEIARRGIEVGQTHQESHNKTDYAQCNWNSHCNFQLLHFVGILNLAH